MGSRRLRALGGACAIATALTTAAPVAAHAALAGATCSGVELTPADAPTLAATVARYPAGTTFCLAPGVYTLTAPIKPAADDTFIGSGSGAGGTELRGDVVLTGWASSGGLYVHAGGVSKQTISGSCAAGSACRYPDDVYWNGAFMRRVLAPCTTTNVVSGTYCIDYGTGRIYLHDNPSGAVVSHASVGAAVLKADGVQLEHFAVSHFSSPAQFGAVTVGSSSIADDLSVSYNHGAGIKMVGNDPVVLNSDLFDNGQVGIEGTGSVGGSLQGTTVQGNNALGFNASWDAGGAKFTHAVETNVTGSAFLSNRGTGLWFDIDSKDPSITGNVAESNSAVDGGGDGIRIEISCGATVLSNTLSYNARHGISISDAHDVTVGSVGGGNTVTGNGGSPIWLVGNGRVSRAMPNCHPAAGTWAESGDVVADNTVEVGEGEEVGFAIIDGSSTTGSYFAGNVYTAVGGCGTRGWRPPSGAAVMFSAWQQAGQDAQTPSACQS